MSHYDRAISDIGRYIDLRIDAITHQITNNKLHMLQIGVVCVLAVIGLPIGL